MYKLVAKNFQKVGNEHRLDLELYENDELIKEKNYSCSFNQFNSDREKRLVSVAMIELEILGKESFNDDYNASDFIEDEKIKVKEEFDNPYK